VSGLVSGLVSTADLRALSERYALAVDTLDLDGATALFLPDGVLAVPANADGTELREFTGTAAIRAALGRVEQHLATQHATLGLVVTGASADTATAVVSASARHVRPGDTVETWVLRYHDTYARTPRGWRYARRELHRLWVEHAGVSALRHP